MAKVYLETSFFSACVSTRTDVHSVSWQGRSLSWLKTQASKHELLISTEVLEELTVPTYPNSAAALAFTAGLAVLKVTPEVVAIAQLLIDQRVMPGPLKGDAVHVAASAFYAVEYLLSWNVKHLANPNKRVHLANVLMTRGYTAPIIVTPDVLWED